MLGYLQCFSFISKAIAQQSTEFAIFRLTMVLSKDFGEQESTWTVTWAVTVLKLLGRQ